MSGKTVYQADHDGWYVGTTIADECEFVAGVFHIPAGCVEVPPPASWPFGMRPRWNGKTWSIQVAPRRRVESPAEKLAAFLSANPDVANLIKEGGK